MRLLGPIILILFESLESQWEQNVKTCMSWTHFLISMCAGVNVQRDREGGERCQSA